jgi:hypothetical protein
MEGQKINPEGPISYAYKGIEWTPFRAKLLFDFYNRSPIDMQCNQSDGSRFPGNWESMPSPPFPTLPPPLDPNEECFIVPPISSTGAETTRDGGLVEEKELQQSFVDNDENQEEQILAEQQQTPQQFLASRLSTHNRKNHK